MAVFIVHEDRMLDREREVPERESRLLRQMTNTPEDAPLPDDILDAFWELKRCGDRISDRTNIFDCKWLAFHCGYGKTATPQELAPPTVAELWKSKQLAPETPVVAKWRGQDVEVVFQRITKGGKARVAFADGEERDIPAEDVSVPELAGV